MTREQRTAAFMQYFKVAFAVICGGPETWSHKAELADNAAVEALAQHEKALAKLPPEKVDIFLEYFRAAFRAACAQPVSSQVRAQLAATAALSALDVHERVTRDGPAPYRSR